MSNFGWDYPPGVTGNETAISGLWECTECTRRIFDETCCQLEPPRLHDEHCPDCCPGPDGEDEQDGGGT